MKVANKETLVENLTEFGQYIIDNASKIASSVDGNTTALVISLEQRVGILPTISVKTENITFPRLQCNTEI